MWTLKNITPEQFDEMYKGTPVMADKGLFEREPESDEDAIANFYPSRLWRLNSGIYKIEDKEGNLVSFQMNYAQHYIYSKFLRHSRIIILKSRQVGASTMWLIIALDTILVEDNTKCGLMAQGIAEAATLKERLERAYDKIPEELLEFLGIQNTVRNTREFALSNDSKIYISTSFRSGTLQFLHISELGKIANKFPEKAKETKTGSMQAIRGGLPVIVESTPEGRSNMFYDMWVQAYDHIGNYAPKDFLPVFFGWTEDPDCRIDVPQMIDSEAEKYFENLEYELPKVYPHYSHLDKVKLDDEQKWWFVAQLREFGGDWDLIHQEYAATPEEAFSATKDGTYYAKLFNKLVLGRGRIIDDLYEPALPVDVAIDLGMNDTMVLVFYQLFRNELRVIDGYHNSGEGIRHYVEVMRSKGYNIRAVWLPHDAKVKELGTGKSRYMIFRELGVPARLLPRTTSVVNDIELVRKAIEFMYFDSKNTTYLQQAMLNYTKQWDDKLGVFKDKPLHNEWSNPADAIRYMVIASFRSLKANYSIRESKSKVKRSNVVDGLALY